MCALRTGLLPHRCGSARDRYDRAAPAATAGPSLEGRRSGGPGLLLVGGVYGTASLLGATPTTYASRFAALLSLGWVALSLGVLLAATARVRALRFGVERRDGSRHAVELPARVDGMPARVTDLSIGGARVDLTGPTGPPAAGVGDEAVVELLLPGGRSARLRATVRSGSGAQRRLEFAGDQWREIAAVAATLFEIRLRDDRPVGLLVPLQRRVGQVRATAAAG